MTWITCPRCNLYWSDAYNGTHCDCGYPTALMFPSQIKEQRAMDAKTYQELALKTMAPQDVIQRRIAEGPVEHVQFDNGVRGLSDEAGELSDISKRIIEYGKGSLAESRDHIKEEVGDCFWRLRQICDAAGLTFEECMESNWNKLNNKDGRYPNGYSDFRAAEENRDREAEKRAMAVGTPLMSGIPMPGTNDGSTLSIYSGIRPASVDEVATITHTEIDISSIEVKAEPVKDGWAIAREIANWHEGQMCTKALEQVDRAEALYKSSLTGV